MATPIQMFQADDGKIFQSEEDCRAYELEVQVRVSYDESPLTYDFGTVVPFDDVLTWLQNNPGLARSMLRV
jgi:hypothetical protein